MAGEKIRILNIVKIWRINDAPKNDKIIIKTDTDTGKRKTYNVETIEDLYDYLCHYQR